ncbi:MAG: hypothetical protein U0835_17090 [Isosphaeraceae bacterium]
MEPPKTSRRRTRSSSACPEDEPTVDPLVLDLPEEDRTPEETPEPIVTERPAPEKKEPPKPAPNRRVAMVAALLAAASVPSAGVYFSQQSELKQLQAARQAAAAESEKAKADAAKAQGDLGKAQEELTTAQAAVTKAQADAKAAASAGLATAKAEVEKAQSAVKAAEANLAAATRKAEDEAAVSKDLDARLKATLDELAALKNAPKPPGTPGPAPAAPTAPVSPVTPALIQQAVQDFQVPEKAQAAFSQFAAKATEGKDASAPDRLIAALGESLKDPAQIDKLIADLDKSIAAATSGPQKSRLIQVKTRLVRAKNALPKGTRRGAFLPRVGRPTVLRVSLQEPDGTAPSTQESELLDLARQATVEDPENAGAFLDLGLEQYKIGIARKEKGQSAAAARYFDDALASFKKATDLLKQSPGSDVSGSVAVGLAAGLQEASQERILIAPAPAAPAPGPVPGPAPGPNPLQARLDSTQKALAQANEQYKASLDQLAKAQEALKTAETRANELNTALGTANQQAKTAKESATNEQQRANGLKTEVDRLTALLKKPGATGPGTGSYPPEPGTLPRYELAVASYIQGIQRMKSGDLPGAEAKFTEAIGWYAEDARFYYHRALVRHLAAGGLGESLDAAQDIRVGAWLEQMNQPPTHVVGKDLVHLQNGLRDWLESRRQAQRLLMSGGGPAVAAPAGAAVAAPRLGRLAQA